MSAGKVDLYAEQGATFEHIIRLSVDGEYIDLTGDTFRGKVRKLISDTDPVVALTCTVLDQTTDKGSVKITLTAVQTAAFELKPQKTAKRSTEDWCYDVERVLIADGSVQRIIEGLFKVSPEVTK